jgi:glutaminase
MILSEINLMPQIEDIYHKTKGYDGGDVARYIPQLARVNPDQYGTLNLILIIFDNVYFE